MHIDVLCCPYTLDFSYWCTALFIHTGFCQIGALCHPYTLDFGILVHCVIHIHWILSCWCTVIHTLWNLAYWCTVLSIHTGFCHIGARCHPYTLDFGILVHCVIHTHLILAYWCTVLSKHTGFFAYWCTALFIHTEFWYIGSLCHPYILDFGILVHCVIHKHWILAYWCTVLSIHI